MQDRITRLRDGLAAMNLDALIVTDNLNARYLSGFTGSYAVLLVTEGDVFLLTDSRYAEQAAQESPHVSVEVLDNGWIPRLQPLAERLSLGRIGFEDHVLSFRQYQELSSALPSSDLIQVGDLVERLRMVKYPEEIASIREAAKIADLTFDHISRFIEPGMREKDIALEIDYFMRRHGAEKEAFDSIVASGPRSALPHGKPTTRTVSRGELIVLDFGARRDGYHSDITRTVTLGPADARQEEIYAIVLEAQSRSIATIRPGLVGREVDVAARDYIASRGYGDHFGHGLGHGLGLSVHDGRILARTSDIMLEAGMVITVEPGIYIPGWGGIRIEDDVLVTESGHEALTISPKALSLEQ